MKKSLHPLFLLSLPLVFFSCEKEFPLTGEQPLPTTIQQFAVFQKNETASVWFSENPFEGVEVSETALKQSICPYSNCSDEIKYWVAFLQPIANNTGEIQWRCITCCQDDKTTYLLLFVRPSNYASAARKPKAGDLTPGACPEGLKKPNLVCNKKFEPVCGCDGNTYPNACFAETAGAANWAKGPCHPCQNFSLIGSVSDIPEKYDPVCGCNGVVYANEYEARNAGITDFRKGPCPDKNLLQSKSLSLTQ